jgi:hypothetical protein
MIWPAGTPAPPMPPASRYGWRRAHPGAGVGIAARLTRPALWAAGIGMAVLGLGVAPHAGRDSAMRIFPAAAPVYAARGLPGGPIPAAPGRDTATLAASCAAAPGPRQTKPPDDPAPGCANTTRGLLVTSSSHFTRPGGFRGCCHGERLILSLA